MESVLEMLNSLNMNELHRAVQENRLEGVQFLIANGADIANTIDGGQTPLHLACSLDLPHIMKQLLKNKCRDELRQTVNAKTLANMTALHLALTKNSLENARLLLSHGAKFDIPDNDGDPPQTLSSDKRIDELFRCIDKVFDVVSSGDSQAILDAINFCAHDDLAAVTYARNSQDYTALQVAMGKFDLDGVGEIVDFRMKKLKQDPWQPGANIDDLIRHSKATRLKLNCLGKYSRKSKDLTGDWSFKKVIVDLLNEAHEFLENYKVQRDPSLTDQPLLIMLEESTEFFGTWETSKFVESIRIGMMLWKGVEFVHSMLKLCILAPMQLFMELVYTSELLDAARRNDFASVKLCLTGHPDLNETDVNHRTALRYAFENNNFEMAKMLLRLGADPSATDCQEERMLLFALRRMKESRNWIDPEVLQLMFDRVSDERLCGFVDAESSNICTTATDCAAVYNDFRLTLLLMSKGAKCSGTHRSNIQKLMDFTRQSFEQARNGQVKELLDAMKKLDVLSLLAIGGTRDERGQTLGQLVETSGHVDAAEQIRKLMSSERADHCRRNAAEFFACGKRVVLESHY